MHCFFPEAVTPNQKIVCALVGVGITGGIALVGVRVYQNRDAIREKIPLSARQIDRVLSGTAIVGGAAYVCIGSVAAGSFWNFYRQSLHSTTECCSIIRLTAAYSVLQLCPLTLIGMGSYIIYLSIRVWE